MARDEHLSASAEAVEALLAYASTGPRWGRGAVDRARRAVALSRELARSGSAEHTSLLARSLRTTARLLLRRRRAAEALPYALEAVSVARAVGGGALVVSLGCLADVLTALGRHEEAAAALKEAETIA
ncbi:tetratricopeptide repeat protein [Thermoactinospora rubra]|uniref:tetratricopeptide repeat protein n=1 Tax=Thermoactinospora rubra TaxID=1088767 RepID=UPI00117F9386|nr:tetratricopeptide repeat protein [Thermoactinospora rubra]